MIVCFTGHRPSKLGGYNWKEDYNRNIMNHLYRVVRKQIVERQANIFYFGGALGIDQMAFEVVKKLQEIYPDTIMIVAVPFKNQSIRWVHQDDIDRYESQLEWADDVVYVDEVDGYKIDKVKVGEYHPAKMQLRNQFMVDNSDLVIGVWDGSDGGTANCIRYAKKKNKELLIVSPDEIQKINS